MNAPWPSKNPDDYRGGAWLVGPPQSPYEPTRTGDAGRRDERRAPRWIAWFVVAPEYGTPWTLLYGAWFAALLVGFGLELLLGTAVGLWWILSVGAMVAADRWWQSTRAPDGPRPPAQTTGLAAHPSKDPANYRGRGLGSGMPVPLAMLIGPLVFSQLLLAGYYATGESTAYLVIAAAILLPAIPIAAAIRRARRHASD